MQHDDERETGVTTNEPVGRVQLQAEPSAWEGAAVSADEGGHWTPPRIALAVAVLLLMVGLLAFMLWGALQAPA